MAKLLYPDYVSLPEVKAAIDKSELKGDHDGWLTGIVNSVFLAAEARMTRDLTAKTRNHDGTVRPLLDGVEGRELWLPHPPIRALRTLKVTPDGTALTRGWNAEFTLDEQTGRIRLAPGICFHDIPEIVEVDYDSGFAADTSGLTAAEKDRFGWVEAAADIKQSIITQAADFAQRRLRGRERVTSFSTDGGTFTVSDGELLDDVRATWLRHRMLSV